MQNLLIADHLVEDIISGRKKNTIRKGRREISLGGLTLSPSSGEGADVSVEVVRVSHKLACHVSEAELKDNGYYDHEEMAFNMKTFYPDFSLDSEVTVITWS